jgi:predicted metal-dependent phosphoesterase TrpH
MIQKHFPKFTSLIFFIVMNLKPFLLPIVFILSFRVLGQVPANLNIVEVENLRKVPVRREIRIPDIPGFMTLKCDFHIHTLFSDGIVWPSTRVDEAWQEGLDAIAFTDHIEKQPKNPYLKGDHNTSVDIAAERAGERGIILIRGGEISRSMPPGHINAIFLKDVNALDVPDVKDAIDEAVRQGAFIFWNHPGWKNHQPDTCIMFPVHRELIDAGKIHGMEVFNAKDWYPLALEWCLDDNLTMMGNTDTHGIVAHLYDLENGHRPMTLVFAKNKDEESIREALFARRTVIWFGNVLIGREELLNQMFHAAVRVHKTGLADSKGRQGYLVVNSSCIPFSFEMPGRAKIEIPAEGSSNLYFNIEGKQTFRVTNLITGIKTNLLVSLDF